MQLGLKKRKGLFPSLSENPLIYKLFRYNSARQKVHIPSNFKNSKLFDFYPDQLFIDFPNIEIDSYYRLLFLHFLAKGFLD